MIKQHVRKVLMLSLSVFLLAVSSCRKNEAPLPDNQVQFESNAQGLAETASEIIVKLTLTRAVESNTAISISLTNTGVTYGTQYTTVPDGASGTLVATVLSGSKETSFTVKKVTGALFAGDEKIVFKIVSSASPVVIGTASEFTLTFAELVATSSAIVGEGGGATYGNKVFFDLSANKQTGVQRTKWDLGFYGGADDFRVIINSSTAMMAKQIDKNDLNAVTAADTLGFSSEVVFNQAAPTTASLAYVDYPDGDLAKTAIAAIASAAADNKVYIINRGKGIGSPAPDRGWKKIRIIRNASGGYTLQHADIAALAFTSVDIPKQDAYFFKYVSFENGVVDVDPEKGKWDLSWTYFSNTTNFGGGEVPYTFQDVILQNRNVEIAKVDTSKTSVWIEYDSFLEADISKYTFSKNQTSIGSSWRVGGGPTSAPVMNTKRYYIIKDNDNNYYKVRFIGLTKNGERGYPAFEYALVKRGL